MRAVKTEQSPGLEGVIASIRERHGAGAVMKLSDSAVEKLRVIPTGSISLDRALGIGGYPCGRITELYGAESVGKSTMALQAISQAHARNKTSNVLYIDAEHALDVEYASSLGVDPDRLYIAQPASGEEALDILNSICKMPQEVEVVVVDSVAALVPQSEVDGEIGDQFMASQARMMSQALRKIGANLKSDGPAVIFINQLRTTMSQYGNPETTPGGRALKFWASVRISVSKGESINVGKDNQIGVVMKMKVAKNKCAPPFKMCEVDMIFGRGMDKATDVLRNAVALGHVALSGSHYSVGDVRLGQGRENAAAALGANHVLLAKIEGLVRQSIGRKK